MRAERSDSGRSSGRSYPSPRSGGSAARGRAAQRPDPDHLDRARAERPSAGGRAPDRHGPGAREAGRPGVRPPADARRPSVPVEGRRTGSSAVGQTRSAPPQASRLHGAVAVLGVFLLTLVAAAADSYIGLGLGLITLVALTIGTAVAALLVRRSDLSSVLIAPPLVFVAVAVANIALAPSASLNVTTLATLLVRGFPAMGIATVAGLLVWLFRRATGR